MAKKTIPSIHIPIQTSSGAMELAWYLYLQQLSEGGSGGGSGGRSKGIDGGFANSVYLPVQKIDGGNANG